jgi:Ubiquitin-like domain
VPELTIETSLNVSGRELKRQISAACDVAVECIKIISAGSVVQDDVTLDTQHVRVSFFLNYAVVLGEL